MQSFQYQERDAVVMVKQIEKFLQISYKHAQIKQIRLLFEICVKFFVGANAMSIPQSIIDQLPELYSTIIKKHQKPGSYKLISMLRGGNAVPECLQHDYQRIHGIEELFAVQMCYIESGIRSDINEIEEQLEKFNSFPIMDLPIELFARIAQYLPYRYRRVCSTFRSYVPIRRATITSNNIYYIPINPSCFLGTGPITITINSITSQSIVLASIIAQNRKLTLKLNQWHAIETIIGQISPVHLKISGHLSHVAYINMDRTLSINLSKSECGANLRSLVQNLHAKSPLLEIIAPRWYRDLDPEPLVIYSAHSIIIRRQTIRTLLRMNIHFAHPPIIANMSLKTYRKLRKFVTPAYQFADSALTGRNQFTMQVPERNYINRSWCTLIYIAK